jgi:hypothetical protein
MGKTLENRGIRSFIMAFYVPCDREPILLVESLNPRYTAHHSLK